MSIELCQPGKISKIDMLGFENSRFMHDDPQHIKDVYHTKKHTDKHTCSETSYRITDVECISRAKTIQ